MVIRKRIQPFRSKTLSVQHPRNIHGVQVCILSCTPSNKLSRSVKLGIIIDDGLIPFVKFRNPEIAAIQCCDFRGIDVIRVKVEFGRDGSDSQ